jgi:hypothetical protein
MGYHYVAQSGLKLKGSREHPASNSKLAGTQEHTTAPGSWVGYFSMFLNKL